MRGDGPGARDSDLIMHGGGPDRRFRVGMADPAGNGSYAAIAFVVNTPCPPCDICRRGTKPIH